MRNLFLKFVKKDSFQENDPLEAGEYHNDLALKFIKKHPEFAPIIKEIKYVEV